MSGGDKAELVSYAEADTWLYSSQAVTKIHTAEDYKLYSLKQSKDKLKI